MKVKVRDVMTRDVITITPDTALKEAAVTMTRHHVSGLPVVEGGRLVGIITEADFVTKLAEDGDGLLSLVFGRRDSEMTGRVSEAMSRGPHTIGPDELATVAARRMAELHVKRLPVVDDAGRLVGVVSRSDLMSIFARPDENIAADVVNDGVVRLLGVAPDGVTVSVDRGVVHLSGTVGSFTEKRMLEEFTRQVAGVVSVESQLEASFDDRRLPPM
ncbi:MAG TPA: CBS domain-containing protein [Acidimicrobiia bacterium]|nr:CBS domain-containing protein [Acidimicrobiia bacterium]